MAEALPRGTIVWRERRTRPVIALFGVPAVFLIVIAFASTPLVLRLAAAAAALVLIVLGARAWPRAVIETYTVTEQEITVARPHEPGVSVPLGALERATLRGDKVHFDTADGPVTMGFVRHQRSLMRALAKVAPALPVERKLDAYCRT